MKIKFGAIIVAGSGKIGGHVASKNRGGAYLRTKVTPSNPNTSYQTSARNLLSSLATLWGTIDANDRLAWNGAVDSYKRTDIFGDIKRPSGFNLFIKLQSMLSLIGEALLDLPPLPVALPPIITGVLYADNDNIVRVTFTEDPSLSATEILVYAAAPQNPGKSFVKSEFRLCGVASAPSTHIMDISNLVANRVGATVPVGKQLFVKLQQVSKTTGQAGIPVILSTVIVPYT